MLSLRAITLAAAGSLLSFATAAATDSKAGFSGILSSLDGGLQGTVSVVDAKTLTVTGYTLEAPGPRLYWWGATDSNLAGGFRISNTLVSGTASGQTVTIKLDAGKTTSDFNYVGLWCEQFSVNFGQAMLVAAGAPASGGPAAGKPPAAGPASPNASTKTGASSLIGALGALTVFVAVMS